MKTTKQDFEQFKSFAKKWQDKFGLKNWCLYFYHTKLKDAYASTSWEMSSSIATLRFCTDWDIGREKNALEIERMALHEVCHVLLAELISQAEARWSTQDALDIAEHSIIRRLESTLLDG